MAPKVRIQSMSIAEFASQLAGTGMEDAVKEAVTESTSLLLARIRRRFLETKSPDGNFWEPSYAAFYRSMMGIDGDTLFDTGNLFHSIQAYAVDPYTGAIGTDVPYARVHNEGLGKMPQREFLGFSSADESLAIRVFLAKIEEALK
jgi:phage gpG-like protein